jgi:type IV pilus assembly protein PilP
MQWFVTVAVMIGILVGGQSFGAVSGVTAKVAQSVPKPPPAPGVKTSASPISKARAVVEQVEKKMPPPAPEAAPGKTVGAVSEMPLKQTQEAVKAEDAYRYETKGRRDPFESILKEKLPELPPGPVKDEKRPPEPLEQFELSSLQLMGIIWGGLGRRAVIKAPDGKGYFVSVGMYMGQNGGQVVAVENDRLVIKEKHRNMKGNVIDKILTIPIRRKEQKG